jgi:Bacterial SH3 domain
MRILRTRKVHSRYTLLTAALALAVLVGAACAPSAPEVVSVPPTKTPKPTFTPSPEWSPTMAVFATATPDIPPTPEATATPAATEVPPSPTPEPATNFTANQTVNVRGGPGTNYPRLGSLAAGQSYEVVAKNAAGNWLEFVFDGDAAWVSADMVTVSGDVGAVEVAQNIPAPPAPAAPRPQPTSPPPPPQPTSPPAPPAPTFDWMYVSGSAVGAPQCGTPNFAGQVQYQNGAAQNGVCVYIDHYGPRQIKFSGSGGQGDGNWGFSPCGQGDCSGPTTIYLVQCPDGIQDGGVNGDEIGVPPPPVSDKFSVNITDKCETGQWTNIIFRGTR